MQEEVNKLLSRIKRIEITAQKLVNEELAGSYLSVFKGRGMNFDSVREYIPGDEVRFIDWNVTARQNHPYVKEFVEERELNVLIVADASASMDFGLSVAEYKWGTQKEKLDLTKRELAALSAAAIVLAAQKNNDRVGLLSFSQDVELYIPPRKGKRHALRIVREVLSLSRHVPSTALGKALKFTGNILKRHSVIFVLTDLWCSDFEQQIKVISHKHDLNFLIFEDPFEKNLLPGNLIPMKDLETGQLTLVSANSFARKKYRDMVKKREDDIIRLLRKHKIPYQIFSTDRPFDRDLTEFFARRQRAWV